MSLGWCALVTLVTGLAACWLEVGGVSASSIPQACETWYDTTQHGDVFVNVRDFGATGDGQTDDTASLQAAIDHNRGDVLQKKRAVVYMPPGRYLVSDTLVLWWATHLMGSLSATSSTNSSSPASTSPTSATSDPCATTVVLAANAPGFEDGGGDKLKPVIATVNGFNQSRSAHAWWENGRKDANSNMLFYVQLHHLTVELGTANPGATGIFWSVAQGCSLRDVTIHAGGGYAGLDVGAVGGYAALDGGHTSAGGSSVVERVTITGGTIGMRTSASSWLFRSVHISGSRVTGVQLFDQAWVFSFLDLQVSDCPVGLEVGTANNVLVVDSVFTNTPIAAILARQLPFPLILSRVTARHNTKWLVAARDGSNATRTVGVLRGSATATGTAVVREWRLNGTAWIGYDKQAATSGALMPPSRPDQPYTLRPRPAFTSSVASERPHNVLDSGAVGDCVHDDTLALRTAVAAARTVFLPAGCYLLSGTVALHKDTRLVGEGLSELRLAAGTFPDPAAPHAMLLTPDDPAGTVVLADLTLTAQEGNLGAVLVQWAVGQNSSIFDVHAKLFYPIHTGLHVTGRGGGLLNNLWIWGADHNLTTNVDLSPQLNKASNWLGALSGIRIDSTGPTWLFGTNSEHHRVLMYNLTGASNVTFLSTQTENPYWGTNHGPDNPACNARAYLIDRSMSVKVLGALACAWFCGLPVNETLINVNDSQNVSFLGVNTYVNGPSITNRGPDGKQPFLYPHSDGMSIEI